MIVKVVQLQPSTILSLTKALMIKSSKGLATTSVKSNKYLNNREEEAINIDGLSIAELKKIREMAEKHEFQAEVSK